MAHLADFSTDERNLGHLAAFFFDRVSNTALECQATVLSFYNPNF